MTGEARRWFIRIKVHSPTPDEWIFARFSRMSPNAIRRFYQRKHGRGAEIYVKPFSPERAQQGGT